MSEPTNYAGILLAGVSLTITGPSGTPAAHTVLDILDGTPPRRNFKVAKWIPQSGANAGKEQIAVGSEESSEISLDVSHSSASRDALKAFEGIKGCAIALTLPKETGQTTAAAYAATGSLVSIAPARAGDTEPLKDTLTFAIGAGWTYTKGS